MKTLLLLLLPILGYSQTRDTSFNELISVIERASASKAKLDSLIESMDKLNKEPIDLPNGSYEALWAGYKLEIRVPYKFSVVVNDLAKENKTRCFFPCQVFVIVYNRDIYLMK